MKAGKVEADSPDSEEYREQKQIEKDIEDIKSNWDQKGGPPHEGPLPAK